MRIATFRHRTAGSAARLGVINGAGETSDAHIVDLARAAELAGETANISQFTDMLTLIGAGSIGLANTLALATAPHPEAILPLKTVDLLAPIPRPRKNIFCVGRNYAEHAAESRRAKGEAEPTVALAHPNIFTKAPTTVNGPYDDVPLNSALTKKLDWEGELAVVIGQGGRHITRAQALDHVWGYTVADDITARDIQHHPGMQWFLGKNFDGSCPLGPWIVTADELTDPQRLRLTVSVNGVAKQDGNTANMIFDVAALIEELSAVLTLEPGDIISTGTPAGVGFARTPPEFLQPGDVVEVTIEGIGTIRNRIVEER